jgi:transposase
MLHAGLDLSRRKLDVCMLSERGEHLLYQPAVPPDVGSLRRLVRRIEVHGEPVCAIVESMTGARLVHDTLEREGWDVETADAHRVKGLAPLACKLQDRLAGARDALPAPWCRRSGCPIPGCARRASSPASHSPGQTQVGAQVPDSLDPGQLRPTLPGTDLFGSEGRRLLARLDVP